MGALTEGGHGITIEAEVFETCKLCRTGGVVAGVSTAYRGRSWTKISNLATDESMYSSDIQWSDPQHWACNSNAHPSRHGTYDGISMHPFEILYVKASWRVGEPHLSRYKQGMQTVSSMKAL